MSKEVFQRFPLAVGLSLLVTLLLSSLIAINFSSDSSELIGRSIMSAIVTFFLTVGVTIYSESYEKGSPYQLLGHFGSLLFGSLFFYFLSADVDNFENIIFFILTLFGIISVLFFSPYIKYLYSGDYKEEGYYVYFYKIAVVFFISCIVGGALAALGNIAIAAVRVLFDLGYGFSGDIHGYWSIASLAFLTPLFALSQLPKKEGFYDSYFNENVFFNFLIRYIAIPFIYIYFFILYAYTLKVLLNFSHWPKGEVSWMVIGFSLFGYITYIFSYIFEVGGKGENYKLISLFRKYFPYIVLPQIAMLFYAIFLRIGQYDMTINRYFVVVFGLWLTVSSLYLIISKRKSLLYIPAFLTLFSIVISIGPWSVYHLPLERQSQRLEKNMVEAGILKNNDISQREIIPLESTREISKELSNQIYDGIDYVCGFNDCKKIQELFPTLYAEIYEQDKKEFLSGNGNYNFKNPIINKGTYPGPTKWEVVSYVTDSIKVKRTYNYENHKTELYNIYNSQSDFPLEISGYDYMIEGNNHNSNGSGISIHINPTRETLLLSTGSEEEHIDITNIMDSLRTSYEEKGNGKLSKEQRSFPIETSLYKGKVIIRNAYIYAKKAESDDSPYRTSLSAIVLLKNK